jgi:nucleoside 2-deoxyribosyltransferase
MNIYFGGSISGGRADIGIYIELIAYLKKYGHVLTEHIADTDLTSAGERDLTNEFIHDRDMEWLKSADVIVAEVTVPSLGVGYELGRAVEMRKKILCLYRPKDIRRLSAMLVGSRGITVRAYETLDEAKRLIDEFLGG